MKTIGEAAKPMMLRLPEGVHESVKILAAKNRRSMNSEVVLAVEHWLSMQAKAKKGNASTAPTVEA